MAVTFKPEELPDETKTDLRLLGFGGGAGHISEDVVMDLKGVEFPRTDFSIWAFNTDTEDLKVLPEEIYKVLIGREVTGGGGAGSDPANGLAAAEKDAESIDSIIAEGEIIIFLACLGGGTGTGSIPFAVEKFVGQIKDQTDKVLKEKRAAIVIVTVPYEREDSVKHKYAEAARELLYDLRCPLIVIPNDKFMSKDEGSRTIRKMNKDGNSQIAHLLGRLIRSLGMRHNLNNIDRNDIILNLLLTNENDSPESYFGVGYGKGNDALADALESAANNPLLEIDLNTCRKAVIAIDCQEAKESDQKIIHDFLAKYRQQPNADWRVGLNDEYEPLPFEIEKKSEAVVSILAVSSSVLEEVAQASPEEQDGKESSLVATASASTKSAEDPIGDEKIVRHITAEEANQEASKYSSRVAELASP